MQEFYKYEDFTKDNVDKKLIIPLIKQNSRLVIQNDKLLIELSKVKNARKYYYDLEQEFIKLKQEKDELDKKMQCNKIELEACYNVIKDITDKNELITRILKEKLNITLDELIKFKR